MILKKIRTEFVPIDDLGTMAERVVIEFEELGSLFQLFRDISELPETDQRAWAEAEVAAYLATVNLERAAVIVYAGEVEAEGDYGGVRQWYKDHPNASLLFTLTVAELDAEIEALDFSSMPTGTANKLKLLLKTFSMTARVLARREGLI